MLQMLRVGTIVTTHGLKGEVKVYPTTENPDRFLELSRVYLDSPVSKKELEIEHVRFQKGLVLVKFKGLDRIEDVENFKKMDLLIDREDGLELGEGEYYIGDIIGLKAINEDGSDLGVVKDIIEGNAHNIYLIDIGKKDIMVPSNKEFIKEINMDEEYVRVHLIPGMLEM